MAPASKKAPVVGCGALNQAAPDNPKSCTAGPNTDFEEARLVCARVGPVGELCANRCVMGKRLRIRMVEGELWKNALRLADGGCSLVCQVAARLHNIAGKRHADDVLTAVARAFLVYH